MNIYSTYFNFLKKVFDLKTIFLLMGSILFFSCNKDQYKRYTCKKNCENIAIKLVLNDSSNTNNLYRAGVPFKILFMGESSSSWINFYEEKPYLIQLGATDINGELNTMIKVNREELNGKYGIYIFVEPTEKINFCNNQQYWAIYEMPENNLKQIELASYCKKEIDVFFNKTINDTSYNFTYQVFGPCYSSESFQIEQKSYIIQTILNKYNSVYINKYKNAQLISSKSYSFFVDENTKEMNIDY